MGRIAVAQGVHVSVLAHARRAQRLAKRLLHRRDRHGLVRAGSMRAAAAHAGEQERGIAVALPALAQQCQGLRRQRHIAVFVPLGRADMDDAPVAVDVAHLQAAAFAQAQPAGVDQRQAGPVAQFAHRAQNPPDLLARQHDGQLVLRPGAGNVHRRPVALEHLLEEKLDPAQRDRGRGPRQPLLVAQIQEVVAQLLVVHLAGALPAPARQPPHRPHIALLRALRVVAQLHLFDHPPPQVPRRLLHHRHCRHVGSPGLRTDLIVHPPPRYDAPRESERQPPNYSTAA